MYPNQNKREILFISFGYYYLQQNKNWIQQKWLQKREREGERENYMD